jgi:hypothetical protein
MIYNNLVLEINNAYGIWNGPETQFGTIIINNICLKPIKSNPEVYLNNNIEGVFPFDTLRLISTGLQKKTVSQDGIPRYIGAFDPSQPDNNWNVGHDFNRSTIPVINSDLPFLRNYILNGSFEWPRNRDIKFHKMSIDQWETYGEVELCFAPGFHIPGHDTRNSIYGNSLLLKSDSSGISQYVENLRQGQEYKFGVYTRHAENCELKISVNTSGKNIEVSSGEFLVKEGWKLLILSFTANENGKAIKVSISKTGKGNAFIDNIGLILVLQ